MRRNIEVQKNKSRKRVCGVVMFTKKTMAMCLVLVFFCAFTISANAADEVNSVSVKLNDQTAWNTRTEGLTADGDVNLLHVYITSQQIGVKLTYNVFREGSDTPVISGPVTPDGVHKEFSVDKGNYYLQLQCEPVKYPVPIAVHCDAEGTLGRGWIRY